MRDQILTAAIAAAPVVAAWLIAAARRYLAQRTYASHVETIRVRARAVAADLQREVDSAKDPARPGEWSQELAAETRAAAVRRVRRLEPLACRVVLDALDADAAALDDLIGTHVEEAVRALRANTPKPAPTPRADA